MNQRKLKNLIEEVEKGRVRPNMFSEQVQPIMS